MNLLLCSYFIDIDKSPNALSRVLPVITLAESNTVQIDAYEEHTIDKSFVNGHYYSDKAPFPTYLIYPIYGLIYKMGLIPDTFEAKYKTAEFLGSFICGSLSFLGILLLMIRFLPGENRSRILTMLAFYGSFVFVFSGTFYSHVMAAFLALSVHILMNHQKHFFLAGILSGLAFLTEYPTAVIFLVWGFQLLVKERSLRHFSIYALGVIPALSFLLFYNWSITGSPISMLYSHVSHEGFSAMKDQLGFGWPNPEAIWKLLISPYRGMLFYAPMLILVLLTIVRHYRPGWMQLLLRPVPLSTALYFLLITCYFMWWGGWSYGPRQLAPIVVLLLFEGLRLAVRHGYSRWIPWVLGSVGISMAWLAKSSILYNLPTEVTNPIFDLLIPRMMGGVFAQNNLLTIFLGIPPKWAVFLWPVLFAGGLLILNQQSKSQPLAPFETKVPKTTE